MGTNFYMSTKSRELKNECFGDNPYSDDYTLVDEPDWGYEIHLAKTSFGWLPLFQAHKHIRSVKDIKKIYDKGSFIIYDEYYEQYSWEEFTERVLMFNGGVRGTMKKEKAEIIPKSHFEYENNKLGLEYFVDEDGYEFLNREFS